MFQERQRRNDVSSRCFINDGVGAWRGQHSLEEPLYQTGAVNLIKTGQMQGDVPFCSGPETVSRGLEVIRQTILPGRRFFPAAATLWSGGQPLLPLLWVLQDDFPSIPKCN